MVVISIERACSIAARILGELPLVEIASATSPLRPSACNWRAKMKSNERSLLIAVSREVSVVKANAGKAARSRPILKANSAAMCCASAAEPPLPKSNSLLPARMASMISRAARATSAVCCAKNWRLAARLSSASAVILVCIGSSDRLGEAGVVGMLMRLLFDFEGKFLATDADRIAGVQARGGDDFCAVDPNAVATLLVNDDELVALALDFGVIAADAVALDDDVVVVIAPNARQ